MNIYEARKLQKLLYKRGYPNNRYMLTEILDDILYYCVYHRISNNGVMRLTEHYYRVLDYGVHNEDIDVLALYHVQGYGSNWPTGMYIAEIIRVD